VLGDIIKARPATGLIPNRCGTPNACVTVAEDMTDVQGISELREAHYVRHVYADRIREEVLPQVSLDPEMFSDPESFRGLAARNTANAWINKALGFPKDGSAYELMEFYRIVAYLGAPPFRIPRRHDLRQTGRSGSPRRPGGRARPACGRIAGRAGGSPGAARRGGPFTRRIWTGSCPAHGSGGAARVPCAGRSVRAS
jgi:hypothetical protein